MNVREYAVKLWDYMHMHHVLQKSDCILVLGSHDLRVALRGAELFLQGWAPYILFSGYLGALTGGVWERPEAEIFAEIAVAQGVPEDKILIENRSTNTGENFLFSRQLLREKRIAADKVIAVHKPYAERRAYATARKVWPEAEVLLASPLLGLDDYPNEEISRDQMIQVMVGDFQRVLLYPRKGYQIYQEIPPEVMEAFEALVKMGYTKYMLKEETPKSGNE